MEPLDDQFTISLPSNSTPDARPSSFRTRLPHLLALDDRWEVALESIIYPYNWPNIDPDATVLYRARNGGENSATIPSGFYGSAQQLIQMINQLVRESGVVLMLGGTTNTVYINVPPSSSFAKYVQFDEQLGRILGLADPTATIVKRTAGDRPIQLRKAPVLYVYTDIIEAQIVGNTHAPLLQVVPVQGAFEDIIEYSPRHLQFIELRTNTLSTITIEIKDSLGESINFNGGIVLVQLRFRRSNRTTSASSKW